VDKRAWAYLRTLALAALLGFPVAAAAVLFQTAIHDVIHFVWDVVPEWLDWSEPAGWYVILIPGIAGVLVALAVRLPGHGGHTPLEGLGLAEVRPVDLVSILPAALATLGLGLVLGPEAPLIALGLGLGAVAVRLVRSQETEAQLLTLAGAFAAIAALFGGPLVAAFLLFEVSAAGGAVPPRQMGRVLLPGFVAAGTGALVFTGIEDWPGMHTTSLSLPALPAYETVRVADLAWCLVISVVIAAVIVGIKHLAHALAHRLVPRPDLTLVTAGVLVGLLAVGFRASADRPVDLVLFSGQTELPSIVAEGSASVLLLLVLAKGLAYALSLGAGFRGGPVFPAIALGVATGVMSAEILPGLETTPGVAIGIAAGTAAVMRVPFTAVLLATLLMGSSAADVAPIAVFAAATGWLVATALPTPEDRGAESGEALDAPVGNEHAADPDRD
jgi:chloride channel protein, CIC family